MARSRETLDHLIELSDLSRREVEKRLLEQGCGTDLGRLLGGRLDLKLRHVLDICRVIGIYPLEFFRMVFKDSEQRSPLLQRLEALIPGRSPRASRASDNRSPATSATDVNEVHRRIAALLGELVKLTATLGESQPGKRY